MKSISVQIVTFNSEKDIQNCLEAVLKQTHPVEQIIVVDNKSSDGTRELLEQYRGRIDLVLNERNTGFAAAHNQAIRMSHSEYVLVLNPDVILHPDYLYELNRFVDQTDERRVGSLTGKLLFQSNPALVDSCGLRINRARRAFDLGSGEASENWVTVKEVFGVSGAAALYRREMIEQISFEGQFFDESFFAYKEDVDVAWRSQMMGWSAFFVPVAKAFHGRGWKVGGRKKIPLFIRQCSYINRYRMMIKNDSFTYILKDCLSLIPYECASAAYAVIKEPGLLVSWLKLIKDLPSLFRVRKFIKQKRTKNYSEIYSYFNK